jgi:hypothetical protein
VPTDVVLLVVAVAAMVLAAAALALSRYAAVSPLWVLGAIAVLQPLNGVRLGPVGSVGDLALVGLALVSLPFLSRLRMPPRVVVPFVGVLVMGAGGLLGMVATDGWWQLPWLTRFALGMPFVIVTIAVVRPSPRLATWLAGCYATGAVVSSIAAIGGPVVPGFARAHGLGEHLMHLAVSTMFGVIFAVGWFVSATTWRVRLFAAAVGLICLWGQLLTGARSALLGTLIALAYLAVLGRRRGITIAGGLTLAGAVVLAAAMPLLPAGSTLHRLFGGELTGLVLLSNSAHLQDARDALAEIGQHPLTGLGFAQGLDAHNLFLEAANMGGVLGVAGFLLIWGTIGVLLVRQLRYGVRREHWVRAAPLVGVMGYFVLAQLENMVWDRHLWFFITVALYALPPTKADPDDRQGDQRIGSTAAGATSPAASPSWTTATSQ